VGEQKRGGVKGERGGKEGLYSSDSIVPADALRTPVLIEVDSLLFSESWHVRVRVQGGERKRETKQNKGEEHT